MAGSRNLQHASLLKQPRCFTNQCRREDWVLAAEHKQNKGAQLFHRLVRISCLTQQQRYLCRKRLAEGLQLLIKKRPGRIAPLQIFSNRRMIAERNAGGGQRREPEAGLVRQRRTLFMKLSYNFRF